MTSYSYTHYGKVPGVSHRAALKNCQDAVALERRGGITVGGVLDGMGSGAHSEVGSLLCANFLVEEAHNIIEANGGIVDIPSMSNALWFVYQRFMTHLLPYPDGWSQGDPSKVQKNRDFANNYLMHTVIMLVHDASTNSAWVIFAGDGYFVVDDLVVNLETFYANDIEESKLTAGVVYPALNLECFYGQKTHLLVQGFRTQEIGSKFRRLAIATDGLRYFLDGDKVSESFQGTLWQGQAELTEDPLGEGYVDALQAELGYSVKNLILKPLDDLAVVTLEIIETQE